jgi:hypothetical protein
MSARTRSKAALPSGVTLRIDLRIGASDRVAPAGRRTEVCGAWAAWAKVSITSPAVSGLGSVRWNARPSMPSRWAMWSIALTTKSTGTMLISPPSIPAIGTHWGTAARIRRISLKK